MNGISAKNQAAKEIVEKFPHTSKSRLAKILFKENPLLFKSVEDARWVIRAVTKSAGAFQRKYTDPKHITDKWVGLQMPEGDLNDYRSFNLSAKKVGLLFDIHIPYHNLKALNIAIGYLLKCKVDTIVLGGDLLDCYQLSDFEKDPRERSFKYEIDTAKVFFRELRKRFKGRVIYLEGNHDYRVERFFRQRAPELLGIEAITLPELLELRKFNIEWVNNKRIIRLGKLNIVHGHEFGRSVFSPVNPARGFYMRAKCNVIGGHHHQTSAHTENDIEGNVTGAWSVGCLSDLHPKYMPLNKWNLGFALVEMKPKGNFVVHNKTIINGLIA